MQKILIILFILLFFNSNLEIYAQDEDELELALLEELNLDSLTIFTLIDSLLSLQEISSQIAVNVGYISQITSSGRDLDINQFGFNVGASYYHKSGLFTNINGFWYSDFDPKYNLTAVSLGYIGFVGSKFVYIGSYDHSFYHGDETLGFNNTLNASAVFDFKYVEPYVDYSFYFGNERAHRINPGITLDLKKKNWLIFESISLRPSFSVIYGNSTIVNNKLRTTDNENFNRFLEDRPRIKEFLESNPSEEELALFLQFFPRVAEFLEFENKNVFGLMNYGFNIPLTMNLGAVNFSISYTYNIPVELPGELFELSSNDYISLSLSYKFKL